MTNSSDLPHARITPEDRRALAELRRSRPARAERRVSFSRGARVADWVATTVGSWRFIVIQSVMLAIWIGLNVVAVVHHWDPYPFILLNLILSFQAAYTAPIIMMSQNRQAEIDRLNLEHDFAINVKAELEIELLHAKIDALREQEILRLTTVIEELSRKIGRPQGA